MSDASTAAAVEEQEVKLGFMYLAPGISKMNAYAFFYASFMVIGLLVFVSTGTAQVLNAMGIPLDQHGSASKDLVIVTEIVQILIFFVAGLIADRIGRREVISIGIVIMGISYVLYPHAETMPQLLVYRGIYAVGLGLATGMVGTLIADYAADRSRSVFVAVGGIFNGLGVVVITLVIAANMAPMLVERGYDPLTASRMTHYLIAAICFVSGIIFYLGLKPGTPGTKEERPAIGELFKSGFGEAINNPRIALSYCCAFVARSDQVVLGTFSVLWGTKVGMEQLGLDFATASGKGGLIFGMAGAASLVWLPLLGFVLRKLNRVTGVIICMISAAIGYGGTYFIDETLMFNPGPDGFPLSTQALWLFLLLGAGQISAFMGATILISAEAPKLKRGAVVGMFNTWGAVGIFIAVYFGGLLFDSVGGYAPFVLIGVLNAVVAVLALIVRIKSPGPMPSEYNSGTVLVH
ncbi:MAG: MFS transporter [Gammaproteobacteria bacterium]|nr:MFS transporter [Gammaproteobacteria bacterium]MCP4275339.1 MFS transporter [Gammaproteobacteria bacterium]MCP4831230.1 MFS transporter [Gammaproteobacteria bacterium]MCP4927641.1 MFS transporter [Gammaproteobacteria bacterium]